MIYNFIMSYNNTEKSINYPCNSVVHFNCGKKGFLSRRLFDLNNKILNINSPIIYVIYLPMKEGNFIKIGFSKSKYDFLKASGRFNTHIKSFNCYKQPLLIKIFKVPNKQIEIKLHNYIKEKYPFLSYKVPYFKLGKKYDSNETYFFDRNLFFDLPNIIQSIYFESINSIKIHRYGYVSDNGFIVN